MIAANLLSQSIIPLKTSDTGQEALSIMNDFYVKHLPIVNNKQLLGLISEDDILDHDIEEAVLDGALTLEKVQAKTKVGTGDPSCIPEVEQLITFYKEKYFGAE